MRALRPLAAAVLTLAASLAGAQSTPPAARPPASRTHTASDLLDINTATPQQLKALPGFGDAYVRRVIAGRPYSTKNQLLRRGVLPQSAYDKIASSIVAHRPPK